MEQEKTIVLGEVSDEQAGKLMYEAPTLIEGLNKAVPRFKKVEDFTTFLAEYAMIGDDLVMHFFGTEEHPVDGSASSDHYWQTYFPNCLNEVGQEHFHANAPRLVAKYTEEMKSWFLKAQGYSHLTDIDAYIRIFCSRLDNVLEEARFREKAPA